MGFLWFYLNSNRRSQDVNLESLQMSLLQPHLKRKVSNVGLASTKIWFFLRAHSAIKMNFDKDRDICSGCFSVSGCGNKDKWCFCKTSALQQKYCPGAPLVHFLELTGRFCKRLKCHSICKSHLWESYAFRLYRLMKHNGRTAIP